MATREPEQVFAARLRELIPEREGKLYAKRAGVSETTLSRWRSGSLSPNPTLNSLKKFAKTLNVSVAYLISEGDVVGPPPAPAFDRDALEKAVEIVQGVLATAEDPKGKRSRSK